MYQCPFGAMMDKSYILDAIKILRESENNSKYQVYAVVAPSICGQFRVRRLGQIVSGLKQLGFFNVIEAALGADMVAYKEAKELSGEEVPHQFVLSRLRQIHRDSVPRRGKGHICTTSLQWRRYQSTLNGSIPPPR